MRRTRKAGAEMRRTRRAGAGRCTGGGAASAACRCRSRLRRLPSRPLGTPCCSGPAWCSSRRPSVSGSPPACWAGSGPAASRRRSSSCSARCCCRRTARGSPPPSPQARCRRRINEIVTTGKLSKLEHFENDEKVRTVNLFGEVWGVGPATALKLYDKGYRTLDDLQKDDSLTYAQRTGLKFFDDIKQRIPRHEVSEMEKLLQDVGKDILPGVIIVCGGSYRRGKASCGDMDIVITHPDGESHVGFLPKFVQRLKDTCFLREDIVFSIHSIEGTDCGVDTYFGLCTYPGRELRHRIDLKVYPRNRYAFGLLAWTGNDVLNRRNLQEQWLSDGLLQWRS